MTIEPTRLVRVTGFNDDLYALDETGVLWSFERHRYKMVWVQLPALVGKVVDLYVHVKLDPWEAIHSAFRVLDDAGKLWELRPFGDKHIWDAVGLEAR